MSLENRLKEYNKEVEKVIDEGRKIRDELFKLVHSKYIEYEIEEGFTIHFRRLTPLEVNELFDISRVLSNWGLSKTKEESEKHMKEFIERFHVLLANIVVEKDLQKPSDWEKLQLPFDFYANLLRFLTSEVTKVFTATQKF